MSELKLAVEILEKMATIFRDYGGWAISSLLVVSFWIYYKNSKEVEKRIRERERKLADTLDKRTEKLMEIIRESTEVIQQNHTEIETMDRFINKVEQRLDTCGKLMEELRLHLELEKKRK